MKKSFWSESDLTYIAQVRKTSDAGDLLPPASSYRPLQASIRGYCQLIANIFILIQYKVQGLSISNLQFSNFDSSSSQIQFESYSLLVSKVWRSQLRCSGELETIRMGWVIDRFVEIQPDDTIIIIILYPNHINVNTPLACCTILIIEYNIRCMALLCM